MEFDHPTKPQGLNMDVVLNLNPPPSPKCLLCKKTKWDHKANTKECPIGRKSRTFGYSSFHKTNVFTPPPPKD